MISLCELRLIILFLTIQYGGIVCRHLLSVIIRTFSMTNQSLSWANVLLTFVSSFLLSTIYSTSFQAITELLICGQPDNKIRIYQIVLIDAPKLRQTGIAYLYKLWLEQTGIEIHSREWKKTKKWKKKASWKEWNWKEVKWAQNKESIVLQASVQLIGKGTEHVLKAYRWYSRVSQHFQLNII